MYREIMEITKTGKTYLLAMLTLRRDSAALWLEKKQDKKRKCMFKHWKKKSRNFKNKYQSMMRKSKIPKKRSLNWSFQPNMYQFSYIKE